MKAETVAWGSLNDPPKMVHRSTILTRVWENGEEWSDEEQLCPGWEEAPTPEDEYWDRYAWEENHYDKDERR